MKGAKDLKKNNSKNIVKLYFLLILLYEQTKKDIIGKRVIVKISRRSVISILIGIG